MVLVVLASAVILLAAYVTYGSLLTRLLRLDKTKVTPAVEMRDDLDYAPIDKAPLMSQHFSAIAAAGPIVGPILAGAMFGWVPALIWILIGSIFVGGVHDFSVLVASIRHRARSVTEVVREHMSRRSFTFFLIFVWFALVYIIVAFTDITAAAFVGTQTLEDGQQVSGGGIATSSLLYLALPIIMGLLVRYTRMSLSMATWIFLPLVGVAIWVGQYIPFDVAAILQSISPGMSTAAAEAQAVRIWDVALLAYCCVASVAPMWILLQPRGQLGGVFLYAALGAGAAGLLLGGAPIQLPAFSGWTSMKGDALFPVLFITVACGACSGFHALVASGTTSKQLRYETDAKAIGYGAMLLEGMVAIVSLCCVMMLAPGSELLENPRPNFIYAQGIGTFLGTLGIPAALGVAFALMAFTTFVYDTLDVCTRLGRYIVQELTGWQDAKGRWVGTLLTAGVPLMFVMRTSVDAAGNPVPVWRTFWGLFGASNQLLAALALLAVMVWLWQTRRVWWVWPIIGIPMVWMYVMSVWALSDVIRGAMDRGAYWDPVTWIAVLLVILSVLMIYEAAASILRGATPRPSEGEVSPAPASA